MGRVWIGVGILGVLLLAGCGQLAQPGGPRPSAASPVGQEDVKVPEGLVDVAVDQAVLDADVRRAREFEALVARAEAGDDDAAFEVAEHYQHGRWVKQNADEAKRWYLQAAEAGHDKARELLVTGYIRGTLYGYEPKADFRRLLPWIKDAARGGNVIAQQILARKYARGEDIPQDYYEARRWLQALAERGDVGAQFSLAVMYHQGIGVEPDPNTAFKWFEAAAKQGDFRAQYMLGLLHYYGRGVGRDLGAARRWAESASKATDSEVRGQALILMGTLDALSATAPKPPPPPAVPTTVPGSGARSEAPAGQAGAASVEGKPAPGGTSTPAPQSTPVEAAPRAR